MTRLIESSTRWSGVADLRIFLSTVGPIGRGMGVKLPGFPVRIRDGAPNYEGGSNP